MKIKVGQYEGILFELHSHYSENVSTKEKFVDTYDITILDGAAEIHLFAISPCHINILP